MAFLDELRNSMGGGSPTKGAAKSVDPNDLKNLGLGGLPSFLGTREDAATGKRGDAQIAATLTDSLPGYFNPETRDYVPWYVDLFDGGGINRSAGMLGAQPSAQGQASNSAMPATQPQGLLANNQLSDMERMQRSDPLGPFGGFGPEVQDTPDTSYYTQPSSMPTPFRTGPEAPGYTQPSSMQVPTPQGGQSIPASGGNMAINTPAAQGRDQMIADQQMYVENQAIKNHPLYSDYVDFLNRSNMASTPGLFQKYVNTFGNM